MRNPVTAVLMGVMLVVVVGNVSAQIAGLDHARHVCGGA